MKISNTAKTLIINVILYTIIVCSLYFFTATTLNNIDFKIPILFGIIYGGLFSVVKVFLLESSINKALTYGPKGAEGYMRVTFMTRYFLTGIVLFISATNNNIDLFGTVVGLVSLQMSAYVMKVPIFNYYK